MASIMPVSNETKSTKSRVTKEGRHLTYEMSVIQQPERARACGSGAKSSADRRPVDPPPVVELRIFEGEAKNDITFSYNANFFLYTTLENARPIAQGRVPTAPNSFPVLTGMPVAGMAYLDRPSPAGYFIFPDLSVRHEGKYRLSFNLFEELKESKDADAEPAAGSPESEDSKPSRNNPMAPQAHVHFRLEVKSVPFNVYSAKKFPGLAESTSLSRIVAEQGCRVRIRRDVRMRRRDKTTKNYDDFDDDPSFARSDRFTTPDSFSKSQMPDRPRSISNGSMETPTGFTPDQRRPSAQEMAYYNQGNFPPPPPPAPQPQSANSVYTSHLSFGGSGAQHYPTSAFQPPSAAVSQSTQSYMPSNGGFQYQSPVHSRPISNAQNGGYSQAQTQAQQPMYSQPQMYPDNSEYRSISDYRRTSLAANHPGNYPSQNMNTYGQVDNRHVSMPQNPQNYYHQTAQAPPPREATPTNGHALPPLKTLQPPMEKKYEPISPVTAIPNGMIGIAPAYDGMQSKYSSYGTAGQSTTAGTTRTQKRSFGAVFNTDHLNQPMHSGMRPSSASHGQDVPQIEAEDGSLEDEYDMQSLKMLAYRRADGSRQLKKCPSPVSE